MNFEKTSNEDLPRLSVEDFKSAVKIPVVVVLDNVRSMHNVGSAFRTSDAFNIEQIFLTGITAKPPHREIQKTALGATESVRWQYKQDTGELLDQLHEDGYTIIAIEQATPHIQLQEFKIEMGRKYCLIFGNEVDGVANEILEKCDLCIEIPQSGTKHSLNISVSIGVTLWKFYSEMHLI